MTFTTKVRAFPAPEVVWKLNDQPVEECETIEVGFQKPLTHTLTLKSVPESLNEAVVTLVATNVGGEASTQSKLTVKGRAPEFVIKPIKCTILAGEFSFCIMRQFTCTTNDVISDLFL